MRTVQGWIAFEQDNLKVAEGHFIAGVKAAFSIKSYLFGMEATLGLAMVWAKADRFNQAIGLLEYLIRAPITPYRLREQAENLIKNLSDVVRQGPLANSSEGASDIPQEMASLLEYPLLTNI